MIDARFVGGSISVSGQATVPGGTRNRASVQGSVGDRSASGTGGTSSGLVQGSAEGTMAIENRPTGTSGAALSIISFDAFMSLSQPEGDGGNGFLEVRSRLNDGFVLDPLIVEVDTDVFVEGPAFSVQAAILTWPGIKAVTGAIDGNRLSAGTYAIGFAINARLTADQTESSGWMDWELRLTQVPAPGAAAIALPLVAAAVRRRR